MSLGSETEWWTSLTPFSCDGVLHLGNQKINSAKATLRLCQRQHTRYLFLTNGGGNTTEDQKAASLLKKVGTKDQALVNGRVIQSHTPLSRFKEESKRDETIYITSLDPSRARDIAHSYVLSWCLPKDRGD